LALNVFGRKVLTVGKRALPGNPALVEIRQPLFEFAVIVAMRHINGADPAIKTTRGNKIWIYHDSSNPFCLPSIAKRYNTVMDIAMQTR
jgi:hypothetical protein